METALKGATMKPSISLVIGQTEEEKMRKRCFVSALVCASFFLSAPSTAQVYGDIEIEWEPVYSPARRPGIHGYGLHRFKVVNRSASKTPSSRDSGACRSYAGGARAPSAASPIRLRSLLRQP